MMGKLAEREKRIVENILRDGDLLNDVPYVPYFSLLLQQKPPFSGSSVSRVSLRSPEHSSSSSSFSNEFCSPECGSPYVEREKRVAENVKKDGELFNDMPCLSLIRQQKLLSSGYSASRASLQSPECSPSSSLFPSGFCSPEDGSLYTAPLSEEAKYRTRGSHYWNGLCLDSKSPHHDSYEINGRSFDEMGLSQSFCGMSIRDDQNGGTKMKGFKMDSDEFGFGFDNGSLGGSVQYNVKKYGLYGGFNDGDFDIEGFQSSPHGVPLSSYDDAKHAFNGFQSGFGKDAYDSIGSSFAYSQPIDLCSGHGRYDNQSDYLLENRKEQVGSWSDWGNQSQNQSITWPYLDDPPSFSSHYKMASSGVRGVMDSSGAPQLMNPMLDLDVYHPLYRSLMLKERIRAITNNGFSHSLMSMKGAGGAEAFSCEDSFIIQGKGLSHVNNKGREPLISDKKNSFNETSVENLRGKNIKPDSAIFHGGSWENDQRLNSDNPLPMVPSINSLSEVQGNIYLMAQDQNGCRWLQRIFDEGTSEDVQIIFNEIIDHVVTLMLKPFGNYVIQKLLDVCNEEQRLQIVFMVTKEPGQLVGICLNTYGTRAAQKLIETLKTRQQILFVVSSLKPGFLDLVKDQNGNHVIQRCLQCLSNEDKKFIFDAAAKFCVEIATHRHGCCVIQRCITHSTGKHRDKLITEISKNSILLAQDPFGNYVVQYIIEQKSPSAIVNLLSQFKRHYVHLSMQKFSSHVVEKCLKHLNESREQIVRELISVPRFEQLLQDPFANYVIQSALVVTKGPLHSLLVDAVRPHVILRTNPYSKRIFSRNLLKK
ncbi:putative pumilio homolog 7, chloroplastic isoform X2 [Hevea brasiliensis]|uniref:putative pumilio homolog 7, chloroplastic isoform X2 n=1 Tax=Hevea brasiliensis TaxID=3981 RepID=UPI0025DE3FB3|nr:putative pumilio homolog 7, chloroplastic isoform X2 [Hevea brasiliensis]